ncbi:hypothetical protein J416_14238 [Gracilibacillus halophilus YIM-C55.5]|uniref:NERD domain-containing protein n=1 Tax=Gracilibacillus halophilus YIM-C55.5 TaxID=1308866 RepID=N4WRG0_9BACI|nr:hypothetical protein [Gracilibacillus halophilus]ENH95801.1 hypothetical protein J416_14238 [Gracilibacillus halophilus YIM-C55.5]
MSQLIKLQQYISRYQHDLFHYAGQYTRLKTDNWKRLKLMWEEQLSLHQLPQDQEDVEEKNGIWNWRSFFKKREEIDDHSEEEYGIDLPRTEDELKHYFLDNLLPFQLKWASTTISQMSFLDPIYYDDLVLKYFLQRIPDTHFLMYHPVFDIKATPIEGDIILISPVKTEIIRLVERTEKENIVAGNDRTWFVEHKNMKNKVLSPLLSLKRTEKIVQSIFDKYNIDLPIQKVVLSRSNVIHFDYEPYRTSLIGVNEHDSWLRQKQQLRSPIKHRQLKAAEALLRHCATTSVRRPEWEQDHAE